MTTGRINQVTTLLSGVKGGLKERLPKVHEMVGTHGRGRRTPLQEIEVHQSLQTPFPDHGVFFVNQFWVSPIQLATTSNAFTDVGSLNRHLLLATCKASKLRCLVPSISHVPGTVCPPFVTETRADAPSVGGLPTTGK